MNFKNLFLFKLVALVFGFSALAFFLDPRLNSNMQLGSEYWKLARSVVDKGYFGNPFGVISGYSSWRPPLYAYLIAFFYFLTKSQFITMLIILFIKNCTLVFTFSLIFKVVEKFQVKISQTEYIKILILFCLCFYHYLFRDLQDTWVAILICDFLIIYLIKFNSGEPVNFRIYGIFGGILLLSVSTLFLMWAYHLKFLKRNSVLLCLLLASIFPGLWTIRNYFTFHKIIPIRSNLYFEMAQANIDNDDGIYTWNELKKHPFVVYEKHTDEVGYLGLEENINSEAEIRFKKYFDEQPGDFFNKSFNRLKAFTFSYYPYYEDYELVPVLFTQIFQFIFFSVIIIGLFFTSRKEINFQLFTLYILGISVYLLVAFYTRYYLYFLPLILLMFLISLSKIRCKFITN